MTNLPALDKAVREVTTPLERLQMAVVGALWPHQVFTAAIRARYRQIVAETQSPAHASVRK